MADLFCTVFFICLMVAIFAPEKVGIWAAMVVNGYKSYLK